MFLGLILPREQQSRFKLRKLNEHILVSSSATWLLKKKKVYIAKWEILYLESSPPPISNEPNRTCKAPDVGLGIRNHVSYKNRAIKTELHKNILQ